MLTKMNSHVTENTPFNIEEFNAVVYDDCIECDDCGNVWDGNAQCMCLGINSDYSSDSDYDEELVQILNEKKNNYKDELIINEYGNYTLEELNTWIQLWDDWAKV